VIAERARKPGVEREKFSRGWAQGNEIERFDDLWGNRDLPWRRANEFAFTEGSLWHLCECNVPATVSAICYTLLKGGDERAKPQDANL